FGCGAATNSFGEIAVSRTLFCIGADMAETNPVAATFVKNAVRSGADLIVAGYETGQLTRHAAIKANVREGSETAFINGLAGVLIAEGLYDKDFVRGHCEEFDEFSAFAAGYTPERAAEISGVDAELIRRIARRLAEAKPAVIFHIPSPGYGSGTEVSIANLQMLLGGFGDGGGVNIIHSRANAQGASDMGAMPDMLPGYQSVLAPAILEKFSQAWLVPGLPSKPGRAFPEISVSLADGRIKAFYCCGEDPAADSPGFKEAIASAELIVCQDILNTEISRHAHVILPSAAWCEADGTYTNSERRVSRVRKVREPAGSARPGWWIFREIARRMGHDWAPESASEIWDKEISELAPLFAGISYRRLEGDGIQWPCTDEEHPGTPVLHKGGCFTRGKGLFIPCE
ncbi:MAG: molybdopterin oxidoreductase family protein, partial [Nitrospirota bacterium]